MKQALSNNLQAILAAINQAADTFCREVKDITLLAVSKQQTIDNIRALYALGIRHFGENQVQEALPKISALKELDITWHFIGSIQSNKTKAIAEHFSWVHSVSDARHATRLNDARGENLPPLNICIQVNSSQEPTKSGVSINDVMPLAKMIEGLPHLVLRGLMIIPAPCTDFKLQNEAFAKIHHAFQKLKSSFPNMDTLSMGMSQDFVAAIAQGATIIRIGRALFNAGDD